MTDAPLWTILIPTLGQREALFMRLLGVLLPQLDEFAGAVRVLAYRNNGSPPIGEVRDALLAVVESEYVSFIDDDDLVPPYYVAEVVRAVESRPDHVGFKLEYSMNGEFREIVDHSLRHGRWHRTSEGLLARHFTHIDPMRTKIARRGSFRVPRRGRPEDRHWVRQVTGHPTTEAYIDKIMYYYLWREDTSASQNPDPVAPNSGRPMIDHPLFEWHPASRD